MKTILLGTMMTVAGLCFSAENDTLISFSTSGTDRYADGTAVRDGECYALVWTRTGTAFAGIAADGRPVDGANSVLLLAAPIAKDGKCPPTVFEISAQLAARHADGSFDVYLLDTRNAAGQVTGVGADGKPERVNGYGWVAKAAVGAASGSVKAGAASASTVSAVPKGTPRPTIKAMKVAGGHVYLTVADTSPCLQYRAVSVGLDGKASESATGAPVDGKAGADIVIVTPAKESLGFFKVRRN